MGSFLETYNDQLILSPRSNYKSCYCPVTIVRDKYLTQLTEFSKDIPGMNV